VESVTPPPAGGVPPRDGHRTLTLVGCALILLLTGLVVTALQGYFTILTTILCGAGVAALALGFLPRTGRNIGNWIESSLYSLFVIGSMAVFLTIVGNHPVTMDGTSSKIYSLSAETRTFLKDRLDRTVRITAFARENERAGIGLLLAEYARHSPFVEYQIRNPFADDLEARRFASQVVPGDAFVELLTTSTLQTERVVRLDKVEEETVTNAIVELLRGQAVNLYFTAGHGEMALESNRQMVQAVGGRLRRDAEVLVGQLRRSHINVATLRLDQRGEVPADASVLVMLAPQRDISQAEFEALRGYMERGGRLLVFLDSEVALGGDLRPPLQLLTELLDAYGISLPQETVVLPMAQRGRRFRMDVQARSHPITQLDREIPVVFDQSRPVLQAGGASASMVFEPFLMSPDKAWRVRNETIARALLGGRDLDLSVDPKELGQQILGAAVTIIRPNQPMEKSTRLVVVGSGSFLGSDVLNQSSWLLFQNAVNWLTDSGDLIAIPAAVIQNTPMTLSPGTRHVLFILLIILIPSVIGIGGTLLSLRRRGVL
jgi:hypothetical protein